MKIYFARKTVHRTAFEMGFANVVDEEGWHTIGRYLRDCVHEPAPAKRGSFKRWLKTKGFNYADIAALTETNW